MTSEESKQQQYKHGQKKIPKEMSVYADDIKMVGR